MRKPAYSVTSDSLVDTFTGDYARAAAMGTFEKYKNMDRNAVLTSGYIEDTTQEYTAISFIDRHVSSKPYDVTGTMVPSNTPPESLEPGLQIIEDIDGHDGIHEVDALLRENGIEREAGKKPYFCVNCHKPLDFPQVLWFQNRAYCSEHLPHYGKESEGW